MSGLQEEKSNAISVQDLIRQGLSSSSKGTPLSNATSNTTISSRGAFNRNHSATVLSRHAQDSLRISGLLLGSAHWSQTGHSVMSKSSLERIICCYENRKDTPNDQQLLAECQLALSIAATSTFEDDVEEGVGDEEEERARPLDPKL